MLIAAGGGGAGGTPWGSMTMQKMQEFIQNPDTEKHYELLTGWKRSADLLIEHRWQVQNYRDNLAAAWPPARNAASLAYITRLDELIANLSETYEAAISNHDAFAAATLSISLAQKDMDEIAREYDSNDQLLATHNAKQQTPSRQPSPSLSGEQPPVAPGRQQELHQRAVTLLNNVSADLALAQVRIRKPRLYKAEVQRDEQNTIEDGAAFVAPPIPPITPTFATDSPTSRDSKQARVTFPTSGSMTPPTALQQTPLPGLILGGTSPTAAVSASAPGPIPSVTPGGAATPNSGPGLLPLAPASLVPGALPAVVPPSTGSFGRSTGPPGDSQTRPGGFASGGAQVMAPGGLIGGVPSQGVAQPGSTRPSAQRINPVGGVIGGPQPHGRAGLSPEQSQHGGSGPFGQTGRGSIRRDQDDLPRWDPDDPWQTASGVDPILLPPPEQRVNPGPAIGLS